MSEMTQEQMVVRPKREDDGWFRIPIIATVEDFKYEAVAEYRHDSEGPVIRFGSEVIPGHLVSRVQSRESYRRECEEDPRTAWPPRHAGALPTGMWSGKAAW